MDFGSKLEELQLTTDEITRFSKALKDEKFREILHEYAEEISKPENKKIYEDEITQLEKERGMNVQFVHPKPHHVLKTSLNGKEKCFINICSNAVIDKPVCKAGRGQGGRVGQHWSLPYSLVPGRLDRESKGNKCTIYDVVFHPDTLYIAGKNSRLMELVNSTATQAVEDAFKVTLDQINAKILKIPYKGVPHPAVIRKPIPGHPEKEKASPFEEFHPIQCPDTTPNQELKTATAVPPQDFRTSPSAPEQPVKPHYTIKYRSQVDLQDYRCSRDSAPSPRPKEIVITVDLPLIKSAGDIDLNVTKRNLVLESRRPEYRLELQLSYPVDDDKGDAKFYKAKKQLTLTLPVLPAEQIVSHEEENADQAQALVCEEKEVIPVEKKICYNADCVRGTSAQDPESGLQFCSDRVESKAALLACEGPNPETFNPEKKQTDEPEDNSLSGPDFFTSKMPSKHHTKVETYSCHLREEVRNVHFHNHVYVCNLQEQERYKFLTVPDSHLILFCSVLLHQLETPKGCLKSTR